MKESFVLKTLAKIKILADPIRMKILDAFSKKPMTTKQVSELLNKKPTALYHHVNVLEEAGFIELIKKKRKRGTVEKYYQVVAKRFTIDRKLFELMPEAKETVMELQAMVTGFLNDTLYEVRQSINEKLIGKEDELSRAIIARTHICASKDKIKKLKKKIEKWLKECDEVDSQDGEVEYGLTLVFYPVKKRKNNQKKK